MKRCPECRRDYYDETLLYCLDDGRALLDGPATGSGDEPATALFSDPSSEPGTSNPSTLDEGVATALLQGRRLSRRPFITIGVLGALLIGGGALAAYVLWPRKEASRPLTEVKITKLTANGSVSQAVVSPDGRQVIYVVNEGGRRKLWLRQIATASDVQLNTPEEMQFWGMTMSRDGNFLYMSYGVGGRVNARDLYQMPVLGGPAKKILENIDSPISFSPDGQRFAFVRNESGKSALMIANADGTGEQKVAERLSPNSFGNLFNGAVAWSPDGQRIASLTINVDDGGEFMNVVEVPVDGGAEKPITSHRWVHLTRMTWLGDGSGLVMTGLLQAAEPAQVWFLSYPEGEARKITNDLNNYGTVSVSADSQILVTVQEDLTTNIWIAPLSEKSKPTQITSSASNADGANGVAVLPDGRILFHSVVGEREDLWLMDADGKNRRQLTADDASDRRPAVSTDGRYIVFTSERAGNRNIWRMDLDGRNPRQLTRTRGNVAQATAEWVVYQSARALWKVPIDGGEPVQISDQNMVHPSISPDGKLIACSYEPPGTSTKIAVLTIEGGPAVKVFDANLRLPPEIHWAPDGRSITYVSGENGVFDIWSRPLDGGEPLRLTDFKAESIFSFAWSADNKLVISHGDRFSDVYMIRNTKNGG